VRTVLVCVRTRLAARNVASASAMLGLTTAVRTAVSEPEAMLQLAEQPAEVVLADTALTRPDSVGFTRRVLARAPNAVIVLFGPEDPRTASAAVAAGARGLIQGGDHDLVSVVAKALLLLHVPHGGPGTPAAVPGAAGDGTRDDARPDAPTVVPAQRGDDPPAPGPVPVASGRPASAGPEPGRAAAETAAGSGSRPARAHTIGRVALTERELQVLRGMAEGKSNAEIGRDLFVSEDTVKTHARRLFRKLDARDRAHAVAAGFRTGLVV
jgi:DNA-binding NarL/FixJ family response regulator